MRREFVLTALAAIFSSSVPAVAGPRTIDDCEAIKDPGAYNLCLASFGPVRGQHGATYPGVASECDKGADKGADKRPERDAAPPQAAKSRHGGGRGHWRGHYGGYAARGTRASNGRVRMEFSPGR